jgi:hypothetical protein
VLEATE